MEMKERKVDYINGEIHLLKPDGNDGWHKFGERKNQKGLYDLFLREGTRNFEVTDEVWDKLHFYMMGKKDIAKYLMRQN